MRVTTFRASIFWLLASIPCFAIAAGAEPKTDEQKTFYALGLLIGQNLASFNLSAAELELVKSGLADSILNKTPQVDLQTYGPKVQPLQQARSAALADKEKKAGKAYEDKAAAEKGSVRNASGMIYTPIKEGSGASPKASDTVKVHYSGTLINGKVFDSSVQRGVPATFALNQVIPCWTQGLQSMKAGGKARLVCPAGIAYGDHGRPPMIPPGATLVFDVELLDIVKP